MDNAGTSPDTVPAGDPPAGEPPAGRRRAPGHSRAANFAQALLFTVLGAIIPGSAFLITGRRKLGAAILVVTLALVGVGIWLLTGGQRTALHVAVSPRTLVLVGIAVPVIALAWIVVVAAGWEMLRPVPIGRPQRALGTALVLLLCVGVAAPTFVATRDAFVQRDLITSVFVDKKTATAPDNVTKDNPWAGRPRVNLLLLGGDGGSDRVGVRTDTVIVASIDTTTGDTVLFSIPRNLENLPFPAGPLRDAYPDGYKAPGNEGEQLLNAVYRDVPAAHPNILGPTDNLGADVLKLGVGEALGLSIDYYVLINLDGFTQLVDALGGVTVNINTWVPIGGVTDLKQKPDDYLTPGADQHLDGYEALWFARGRYGSTDYDRMDRQRCVLNAIITQANPVTVLTRYQQLAQTTKDIVDTDLPQSLLGDFVDLSLQVKDADTTSIVFDDTVINPAYPDYDLIRSLVQQALNPPAPTAAPATSAAPSTSAAPTSAATTAPGAAEQLSDSCAFDAVLAQAALASGKPPTRR